jgi:hypothetical protein
MRGVLLDELRKPYVVTARAKGMPERPALFKYPVRVAINPILSGMAGILPALVSGGTVVEIVAQEHQPVQFATFAPVAFAGIGQLPDTLEDRSVPIVLQRKGAGETVERMRATGARANLAALAAKLARWAEDEGPALVFLFDHAEAGLSAYPEDHHRLRMFEAGHRPGVPPARRSVPRCSERDQC